MYVSMYMGLYTNLFSESLATALTSDGQLRREPAISGTSENNIVSEIL